MKKMTKRMVALLLVVLLMAAFALPVMAAERVRVTLKVGDTKNLGWSRTPYESSDPDVVRVEFDGDKTYTAVAVGEGTAIVSGGTWAGVAKDEYEIAVTAQGNVFGEMQDYVNHFQDDVEDEMDRRERKFDVMKVVAIVLSVLMGILLIGAVVYIFISAPKCGMSRWWALLPLFSHVLGLIVFIVMRSTRQTQGASANTFVCPTCSAVHPYGTATCSVCGKKFY